MLDPSEDDAESVLGLLESTDCLFMKDGCRLTCKQRISHRNAEALSDLGESPAFTPEGEHG